jgi:DNA-binding transcriptional LysR family regulator
VLGECDEVDAGTLHASFRRPSPAFSIQNLRYALAAADYGSFRRAAEALLLRQSTLSRCVRQLEESIGMAVFERSSGGVRATQGGRHFLRSARSILEQVEALAARTQSTGRGEAGRLTVGFYTSLAAGNLRATLIDVSQRFPQLELEMFESSRSRLVTALRNGVVDIVIIPGATALPESKTMSLWSERILVAAPEGHALAERDSAHWIDLRQEKILLSRRDPGPELHDLLIAKAASPGDRPKIMHHRAGLANVKSLVGAGFGVTVLTEACAGASFPGVIYRELRDGAEPARIGYSAHWRADNQNPALASILRILGERYLLPVPAA